MRKNRVATAGAVLAAASLVIAGCSSDDSGSSDAQQGIAAPSGGTSKSTDAKKSSTKSSSSETSSSSESEEPEAPEITQVSEADFTPADGPNTRLFQLADGSTKCFLNDIGGDVFLACQANLNNPPMVPDASGNMVPANAVSWNPSGVTYETLMFPSTGEVKTLEPNQQLDAYGYTCTSHGPSNVECSGAAGAATIDSGNVTGARVPEPKPANEAPAPEQNPAPAPAPADGLGDLLPGLPPMEK